MRVVETSLSESLEARVYDRAWCGEPTWTCARVRSNDPPVRIGLDTTEMQRRKRKRRARENRWARTAPVAFVIRREKSLFLYFSRGRKYLSLFACGTRVGTGMEPNFFWFFFTGALERARGGRKSASFFRRERVCFSLSLSRVRFVSRKERERERDVRNTRAPDSR